MFNNTLFSLVQPNISHSHSNALLLAKMYGQKELLSNCHGWREYTQSIISYRTHQLRVEQASILKLEMRVADSFEYGRRMFGNGFAQEYQSAVDSNLDLMWMDFNDSDSDSDSEDEDGDVSMEGYDAYQQTAVPLASSSSSSAETKNHQKSIDNQKQKRMNRAINGIRCLVCQISNKKDRYSQLEREIISLTTTIAHFDKFIAAVNTIPADPVRTENCKTRDGNLPPGGSQSSRQPYRSGSGESNWNVGMNIKSANYLLKNQDSIGQRIRDLEIDLTKVPPNLYFFSAFGKNIMLVPDDTKGKGKGSESSQSRGGEKDNKGSSGPGNNPKNEKIASFYVEEFDGKPEYNILGECLATLKPSVSSPPSSTVFPTSFPAFRSFSSIPHSTPSSSHLHLEYTNLADFAISPVVIIVCENGSMYPARIIYFTNTPGVYEPFDEQPFNPIVLLPGTEVTLASLGGQDNFDEKGLCGYCSDNNNSDDHGDMDIVGEGNPSRDTTAIAAAATTTVSDKTDSSPGNGPGNEPTHDDIHIPTLDSVDHGVNTESQDGEMQEEDQTSDSTDMGGNSTTIFMRPDFSLGARGLQGFKFSEDIDRIEAVLERATVTDRIEIEQRH